MSSGTYMQKHFSSSSFLFFINRRKYQWSSKKFIKSSYSLNNLPIFLPLSFQNATQLRNKNPPPPPPQSVDALNSRCVQLTIGFFSWLPALRGHCTLSFLPFLFYGSSAGKIMFIVTPCCFLLVCSEAVWRNLINSVGIYKNE